MKIFVLGTRGFPNVQGGVEKHCEKLYPRLVELGCDVTVCTRIPYMPKEKRISEWSGVKFFHLWTPHHKYFEAIVHTFMGIIIARIRSFDLLHIHTIGPSLLVPLVKLLGLKVVVTTQGFDYNRTKWGKCAKFVLRLGELLGTKFSDRVIVVSRNVKEFLEQKYKRKDLEFIPNGVELSEVIDATEILNKHNLKRGEYLFTVSRIVPEKGLHDLIKAYSRINSSEFKLAITGDADHETTYSRRIKTLAKKSPGVILTGFLSGMDLNAMYTNAGLFVLPSYHEGLPLALLEALSYGLPVLVSDIPAHRELTLEKSRYFPVGNIDVLSKKMVELFNTGISKEERQRNRQLLLKKYNWDTIAKKTMVVYNSLFKNTQ